MIYNKKMENIEIFKRLHRIDNLKKRFGPSIEKEIVDIISASWGDYGLEKIHNLLQSLDVIIISSENNKVIGFLGYSWIFTNIDNKAYKILRISLTAVNRNYQRKGIMIKMVTRALFSAFRRNRFKSFFLGLRTADPIVCKFIYKYCHNTFPRLADNDNPPVIIKLAKIVSEDIDSLLFFDEKEMVARNAYKNRLDLSLSKKDLLSSFDNEVANFLKNKLNYDNGDALIIITKVSFFLMVKIILKNFKLHFNL